MPASVTPTRGFESHRFVMNQAVKLLIECLSLCAHLMM